MSLLDRSRMGHWAHWAHSSNRPTVPTLCPREENVHAAAPGYVPLHPGMYPGCTSCPLTSLFLKRAHRPSDGREESAGRHVPTRVPTNENSPRMNAGIFIGGMAWAQLRNVRNCCHFIGAHVGTRGHTWAHGPTWAHLGTLGHTWAFVQTHARRACK